jgi:peptide/nickel transport system substrate-binding protein
MRRGLALVAAVTATAAALTAGCTSERPVDNVESSPPSPTDGGGLTEGSPSPGTATGSEPEPGPVSGGVLRTGSTSRIDSLNPFVAFNRDAFMMIYPALVQYGPGYGFEGDWAERWDTSPDGLVWTFTLKPGSWSDGAPLTAEDAAWTCNLGVRYRDGPTRTLALALSHVERCSAPDPGTLVVTYKRPVGNALAQLRQFYVLPRHVWEEYLGVDGNGLRRVEPEESLPIVAGGPFTVTSYDRDGTTIYEKNPGFYGEEPYVDSVALRIFTNEDALVEALRAGGLDAVDELPIHAADAFATDGRFELVRHPWFQINNIIFNSNPNKPRNRELLDPRVREAFAHAIDREAIADTVYDGYATPVASIVAPVAGDWFNPTLQPESYDIELANEILDKAGYTRGGDGIRIDEEGERMAYEIITPTGVRGIDSEFDIVRAGLEQIGIEVTQRPLDDTAAFEAIGAPDWKYTEFDLAMWSWVGSPDPDFILSVVTCNEYGSLSDTGYCNPAYEDLYRKQGATVDQEQRRELVWSMQEMLYEDRPYIQLVAVDRIAVWRKGWEGLRPDLVGFSKRPWIEAHQVTAVAETTQTP